MSEPIKLSQEELDSIKDLREKIRSNVEKIGRLNIKRHFTETELNLMKIDIDTEYLETEELSRQESKIVDSIVSKYGDGDLDFNTGLYTPRA
jgi:hypothetical protein